MIKNETKNNFIKLIYIFLRYVIIILNTVLHILIVKKYWQEKNEKKIVDN